MILIKQDAKLINEYLSDGKIVAIPTETVYGLAVKLENEDAVKKLSKLKNREEKMFSMMIYEKNDINKYAIVSETARKIIERYFPGQLTIVLPLNKNFKTNYFKDTIGIRIPEHELMLKVLKESGPLLVTSANYKGEKPCLTSDEVLKRMDVDIVVEGKSGKEEPSTVLKLNGNDVEVLRQGNLFIEKV